jgi:serine/threonine protein kinase
LYFTERISVVCELHPESLADIMMSGRKSWSSNDIIRIMHQVAQALAYLETHNIVHRALSPSNILMGNNGEARLFNYGLYYMTGGGKFVSFPVG